VYIYIYRRDVVAPPASERVRFRKLNAASSLNRRAPTLRSFFFSLFLSRQGAPLHPRLSHVFSLPSLPRRAPRILRSIRRRGHGSLPPWKRRLRRREHAAEKQAARSAGGRKKCKPREPGKRRGLPLARRRCRRQHRRGMSRKTGSNPPERSTMKRGDFVQSVTRTIRRQRPRNIKKIPFAMPLTDYRWMHGKGLAFSFLFYFFRKLLLGHACVRRAANGRKPETSR